MKTQPTLISSPNLARGDVARIALASGVPYSTAKRILKGETPNPGIHTVRKIEAALQALKKPASRKARRKGARR